MFRSNYHPRHLALRTSYDVLPFLCQCPACAYIQEARLHHSCEYLHSFGQVVMFIRQLLRKKLQTHPRPTRCLSSTSCVAVKLKSLPRYIVEASLDILYFDTISKGRSPSYPNKPTRICKHRKMLSNCEKIEEIYPKTLLCPGSAKCLEL